MRIEESEHERDMTERAYLDWNATAPLRPQARAAMVAALDAVGNPSSVHAEGRAARAVWSRSARAGRRAGRRRAAQRGLHLAAAPRPMRWRCRPHDAAARCCERLLVSAIEHPSVRRAGGSPAVESSRGRRPAGIVDLARSSGGSPQGHAPLVSLMLANNETGVDPAGRARRPTSCMRRAACCMSTRSRRPGELPAISMRWAPILLTLSAHKIGGPKGAGALVLRDGLHLAEPLIKGGGQERGVRAGTENVAGDRGLRRGRAARPRPIWPAKARGCGACATGWKRACGPRRPTSIIFGAEAERLPNTTLFARARHQGRNRRDRLRSGGGRGVVGRRLLVRQGAALACAGGHGRDRRSWRAGRSASAWARPRPKPISNAFSMLGERSRGVIT